LTRCLTHEGTMPTDFVPAIGQIYPALLLSDDGQTYRLLTLPHGGGSCGRHAPLG
jgi:hypothetical protein